MKGFIELCGQRGVQVVFTAFAPTHRYLDRPHGGAFMPNRYPELGPPDPAWFRDWTIWHELAPRDGEVVIFKPSCGAFHDTPLETILRNLDRDTVIICGTLTSFCCGTTTRQACERGFKVVFGSDVAATGDPAMQEAELEVLRKGFAKVLPSAGIAARLRSRRAAPPGGRIAWGPRRAQAMRPRGRKEGCPASPAP